MTLQDVCLRETPAIERCIRSPRSIRQASDKRRYLVRPDVSRVIIKEPT